MLGFGQNTNGMLPKGWCIYQLLYTKNIKDGLVGYYEDVGLINTTAIERIWMSFLDKYEGNGGTLQLSD